MSNNSVLQMSFVCIEFKWQTVLIDPKIGPCQVLQVLSGPETDDNEVVIRISWSSCIAGASSSDYLVSYSGHVLGGVLPRGRDAVGVFYSRSRQS